MFLKLAKLQSKGGSGNLIKDWDKDTRLCHAEAGRSDSFLRMRLMKEFIPKFGMMLQTQILDAPIKTYRVSSWTFCFSYIFNGYKEI